LLQPYRTWASVLGRVSQTNRPPKAVPCSFILATCKSWETEGFRLSWDSLPLVDMVDIRKVRLSRVPRAAGDPMAGLDQPIVPFARQCSRFPYAHSNTLWPTRLVTRHIPKIYRTERPQFIHPRPRKSIRVVLLYCPIWFRHSQEITVYVDSRMFGMFLQPTPKLRIMGPLQ